MMANKLTLPLLLCLFLAAFHVVDSVLLEVDRQREYDARRHVWPPQPEEYVTEGWRKIFERRFRQIDALDLESNSYNGYMGSIHAGLLCPNFTEYGWGLTKAPQGLVDELKTSLHRGLAREHLHVETEMASSIQTPNRPFFIHQNDLNNKALQAMKPLAEAWSSTKLIGSWLMVFEFIGTNLPSICIMIGAKRTSFLPFFM